jgi:ATP-binding cassette subfamily B protein RaxB
LVFGTLGMMLLYNTKLAAIAGLAVGLYIVLRLSIFNSMREATAEQIIHTAKQQSHLLETLRGVQTIRLFGRASERHSGWINLMADQFNAELRIARLSISYQTANTLLFGSERIIIIWLAALSVIDNHFSVGMLLAFISYKDQFTQRIVGLVDKLFDLRMMKLHGERVADIVLTEPERTDTSVEVDTSAISASIEFRNVVFRHADSEPNILNGFTLSIPEGQCIAITGTSGSGKTTLVKLLLGLLEPVSGEILIGGIKLENLGKSNFRKTFGTVMQDDILFSGSISENICFFDPDPNHDHIRHCARLSAIHDEISNMPMSYNTLIGDIGTGISGGQKQRILLARALYKNPSMLVLDEATSQLDIWNEQVVNLAIQKLRLTRIIVAHRPETIKMAQRVVVMQQGVIMQDVAQGPDELIAA